MEAREILHNIKTTHGDDESWLTPGWLTGSCIEIETRAGIIDWLIQCQQYLGLSDCCLHVAVANFDLALANVDWDHGEVQLMALACLQLAAKSAVDGPPGPALFLPLAGNVYSQADLARVEMEVMVALDWSLHELTACELLQLFADVVGKGRKPLFRMANAILDQCLYQDWYGCEKPSKVANGCLAAATCLLGQEWCQDFVQLTKATFNDTHKVFRICLSACISSQREGFIEKHGKSGRNLSRLQVLIRDLIRGA